MSTIPKIFEQLLYKEISPVLMPLIADQQHGFLTRKSTNTNLISFCEKVLDALSDRAQCILTDYSKAFDKININISYEKLSAYGIVDPLLSWFRNCLSCRKQIVQYKSPCFDEVFFSKPFDVSSGCPQGGHLSGLLFNLYINDICKILDQQFWLFADDKKIGRKICNIEDANLLTSKIVSAV